MTAPLPTVPAAAAARPSPGRGRLYRTTSIIIGLILGAVLVDGLGAVDVFGVDTQVAEAAGGGYALTVTAPSVSRPGLATPLEVVVTRSGGFEGPVEVAFERAYLQQFDFNRWYPEPSAERSRGPLVVMEFDPPDSGPLTVSLDARLEPSVQAGRDGRMAVLEDGSAVVEVSVDLRVWP